jgi:hypothetical protein
MNRLSLFCTDTLLLLLTVQLLNLVENIVWQGWLLDQECLSVKDQVCLVLAEVSEVGNVGQHDLDHINQLRPSAGFLVCDATNEEDSILFRMIKVNVDNFVG